jgi:hypothetical protein
MPNAVHNLTCFDRCDMCRTERMGTLVELRGTPVIFTCKKCDEKLYIRTQAAEVMTRISQGCEQICA